MRCQRSVSQRWQVSAINRPFVHLADPCFFLFPSQAKQEELEELNKELRQCNLQQFIQQTGVLPAHTHSRTELQEQLEQLELAHLLQEGYSNGGNGGKSKYILTLKFSMVDVEVRGSFGPRWRKITHGRILVLVQFVFTLTVFTKEPGGHNVKWYRLTGQFCWSSPCIIRTHIRKSNPREWQQFMKHFNASDVVVYVFVVAKSSGRND